MIGDIRKFSKEIKRGGKMKIYDLPVTSARWGVKKPNSGYYTYSVYTVETYIYVISPLLRCSGGNYVEFWVYWRFAEVVLFYKSDGDLDVFYNYEALNDLLRHTSILQNVARVLWENFKGITSI